VGNGFAGVVAGQLEADAKEVEEHARPKCTFGRCVQHILPRVIRTDKNMVAMQRTTNRLLVLAIILAGLDRAQWLLELVWRSVMP